MSCAISRKFRGYLNPSLWHNKCLLPLKIYDTLSNFTRWYAILKMRALQKVPSISLTTVSCWYTYANTFFFCKKSGLFKKIQCSMKSLKTILIEKEIILTPHWFYNHECMFKEQSRDHSNLFSWKCVYVYVCVGIIMGEPCLHYIERKMTSRCLTLMQ